MKIDKSGATYSQIVRIGEMIQNLENESGEKYLRLNRGINSVCLIDLNNVVQEIDCNTANVQFYAPNAGMPKLKAAINEQYFLHKINTDNLFITAGGMQSLDLIFSTLDVDKVYIPYFYWGAYLNMLKIRKKEFSFYESFDFLKNNLNEIKNSAVIICDPNNPLGNKIDDIKLLEIIEILSKNGTTVVVDSPYRRVFKNETDEFYSKICQLPEVIVSESFSKSLGLSGLRVGFLHSTNVDFCNELKIRLLFTANGVNAFAQELIYRLLTTEKGKQAVTNFKSETVKHIQQNIDYLKNRNFLADEFYTGTEAVGIFAVIRKSQEELLKYRIGSVSLKYFTKLIPNAENYSRICVSVNHADFQAFFDQIKS